MVGPIMPADIGEVKHAFVEINELSRFARAVLMKKKAPTARLLPLLV